MKITEIFVQTGEVIERDATEAEIAQAKIDAATEKQMAKIKAETIAAKQAVLDRLGITSDEAALLVQ